MAGCKFNLTNEEFAAVIAHYKEPETGDILYLKFLHDAAPSRYPLEAPKEGSAESAAKDNAASPTKSIKFETVMAKIKNVVKQKRIRIEEFFLDHDSLRKGDVTIAKFRSCLDGLK